MALSDNEESGPQTPQKKRELHLPSSPAGPNANGGVADNDDLPQGLLNALSNEILLQTKNVDWFDISLALQNKGFVKAGVDGKKMRKNDTARWSGEELRAIFRAVSQS